MAKNSKSIPARGLRVQDQIQRDLAEIIAYELKDPRLKGGGPHYVIDAATGAIVLKRYEQ